MAHRLCLVLCDEDVVRAPRAEHCLGELGEFGEPVLDLVRVTEGKGKDKGKGGTILNGQNFFFRSLKDGP